MQFHPELRLPNIKTHVRWVFEIGDKFLNDPNGYKEEMRLHQDSVMGRMNPVLLESGYFFPLAIGNFIIARDETEGIDPQTLDYVFHRLLEWGLVEKPFSGSGGNEGQFMQFCRSTMEKRWSWNFVENICIGMKQIISKYQDSIPSIIISQNGIENIGTGFLIEDTNNNQTVRFVLTNKHVAESARIKEICSTDFKYEHKRIFLSDKYDLAAIEVINAGKLPVFNVWKPQILDEVVTLGYPKVSGTVNSPFLAHRGEINGYVSNYHDGNDYLAISCSVAPGNSGGPVLNGAGLVVGVVSETAIQRSTGSNAKIELGVHHLAVPMEDIVEFIHREIRAKY